MAVGKAGAAPRGGRRQQRPQAGRAQTGGVGYNAKLGQESVRRYLPARRLQGATPGMGAAQNQGRRIQQQPFAPRPPQVGPPRRQNPPAPNGIPQPEPPRIQPTLQPQAVSGAPAMMGGAKGVYSYDIAGSPNMAQSMDTGAITSGLARLNRRFNQLPLTPGMALGQAGLLSDLQNRMAQAQAGYGNVASQYNLGMGRLQTDQAGANADLGASMADRGVLMPGSGVAANQYTMQANDFNRQRQDMAAQAQAQLAEYQRQMQEAYGNYGQGLSGLALNSARYSSGNRAY